MKNEEQFPNLEDEVGYGQEDELSLQHSQQPNWEQEDWNLYDNEDYYDTVDCLSPSTYISRKKAFWEDKNINFSLSPTPWKKPLKKIFQAAHGERERSTSVFLTGYLPMKKLLTMKLIL